MPDTIIDPQTHNGAKVGSNFRLHVDAIQKSEAQGAIDVGDAYNINTGQIIITGTTAVLYIKNNESKKLFIEALAIGVGAAIGGNAVFTDNVEIFIVRNPTTGTMITAGVAVDMNVNRNFGEVSTLTADAFKGATGETFTNGTDGILIAQNGQGRVFATIGMELEKGNTIGIRINPNLDATNCEVYAAIICHLETDT